MMSQEHKRRGKETIIPPAPPVGDSSITISKRERSFSYTAPSDLFPDNLSKIMAIMPSYLTQLDMKAEEPHERETIVHANATYSMTNEDRTVLCDATSGAFTVKLPYVVLNPAKLVKIVKVDAGANAITIACSGSDKIEGDSTKTLSDQYSKLIVFNDGGSQWLVVISS
jgi:hypothetical protein